MVRSILLSVFSALLFILSFPKFDLSFLPWIGLVPLLIALKDKSLKFAFGLSFLTGFIFFMGVYYWVNVIGGFKLINFITLLPYFALYFGLFGLAFCFISKRNKLPSLVIAPVLWVAIEFLRSNIGFLRLPCSLLGHSQYLNLPIIQISALTGAYGVSLLIVMVNVSISELLFLYLYRNSGVAINSKKSRQTRSSVLKSLAATAIVMALSLVYGFTVLSKETGGGGSLSIAVVQPNIPQNKKWKRKFEKENLNKHLLLSKNASTNHDISLLVWPESAVRGPLRRNVYILRRLSKLVKETKAHLIVGSSQRPKFGPPEFRRQNWFNSAFLISPQGKIEGKYNKIRLLPFGEYLPYRDLLPWPSRLLSNISKYIPGNEHTIFNVDGARFGVLICWESLFPGLFRQFVKNGANFMLNITNEAWFGETAAPYQFLAMNVFRAVENRIPLIRCANTGISCFIGPHGRIMGRVQDNNRDIFVEGYLAQEIPLSQRKTFYTVCGDILAFGCIAITLCLMLWSSFEGIMRGSGVESRSRGCER